MNKDKVYTIIRIIFGFMIIGSGIAMLFGLTDNMNYTSEGATDLWGAFKAAGYFLPFLAIVKIVCGLAILLNRFAKVALVIFMPVSIHMVLFHIAFLEIASGVPAYMILAINTYLLFKNLDSYRSMLTMK